MNTVTTLFALSSLYYQGLSGSSLWALPGLTIGPSPISSISSSSSLSINSASHSPVKFSPFSPVFPVSHIQCFDIPDYTDSVTGTSTRIVSISFAFETSLAAVDVPKSSINSDASKPLLNVDAGLSRYSNETNLVVISLLVLVGGFVGYARIIMPIEDMSFSFSAIMARELYKLYAEIGACVSRFFRYGPKFISKLWVSRMTMLVYDTFTNILRVYAGNDLQVHFDLFRAYLDRSIPKLVLNSFSEGSKDNEASVVTISPVVNDNLKPVLGDEPAKFGRFKRVNVVESDCAPAANVANTTHAANFEATDYADAVASGVHCTITTQALCSPVLPEPFFAHTQTYVDGTSMKSSDGLSPVHKINRQSDIHEESRFSLISFAPSLSGGSVVPGDMGSCPKNSPKPKTRIKSRHISETSAHTNFVEQLQNGSGTESPLKIRELEFSPTLETIEIPPITSTIKAQDGSIAMAGEPVRDFCIVEEPDASDILADPSPHGSPLSTNEMSRVESTPHKMKSTYIRPEADFAHDHATFVEHLHVDSSTPISEPASPTRRLALNEITTNAPMRATSQANDLSELSLSSLPTSPLDHLKSKVASSLKTGGFVHAAPIVEIKEVQLGGRKERGLRTSDKPRVSFALPSVPDLFMHSSGPTGSSTCQMRAIGECSEEEGPPPSVHTLTPEGTSADSSESSSNTPSDSSQTAGFFITNSNIKAPAASGFTVHDSSSRTSRGSSRTTTTGEDLQKLVDEQSGFALKLSSKNKGKPVAHDPVNPQSGGMQTSRIESSNPRNLRLDVSVPEVPPEQSLSLTGPGLWASIYAPSSKRPATTGPFGTISGEKSDGLSASIHASDNYFGDVLSSSPEPILPVRKRRRRRRTPAADSATLTDPELSEVPESAAAMRKMQRRRARSRSSKKVPTDDPFSFEPPVAGSTRMASGMPGSSAGESESIAPSHKRNASRSRFYIRARPKGSVLLAD